MREGPYLAFSKAVISSLKEDIYNGQHGRTNTAERALTTRGQPSLTGQRLVAGQVFR